MHSTDCLHRMLVSNLISLDHEKLWTAYGMGNCWSNSAKAVFLEVEADHMRSSRNRTLWDSWRSTWSPGTWRWMKDWSKSNKMQEVLEAESWNQGSAHGLGLQGLVVFFCCFCCTWLHCYLRLSDRIPTPHVSSELVQDFGTECLRDFQMLIHHQNVHGILGIQQLHVDERWEDQESWDEPCFEKLRILHLHRFTEKQLMRLKAARVVSWLLQEAFTDSAKKVHIFPAADVEVSSINWKQPCTHLNIVLHAPTELWLHYA